MFKRFVQTAVTQDDRNRFTEYAGNLEGIPSVLHTFYQKYNPEDVEIIYGADVIHFIPAQKLMQVKQEYPYLDTDIIIATINGDPVFMKRQKVYTCPHGTKQPKIEKMADSFEELIEELILSE